MTDDEFLAAFEDCSLPRKQWTHEAHVRMAWLYLTRRPFPQALRAVRAGIQRYNNTAGDGTGYHDTLTVAFVHLIADRLTTGEAFAAFRDRNPDLFDRGIPAVKRHYSDGRLNSDAARDQFIEPDRAPLPEPAGR